MCWTDRNEGTFLYDADNDETCRNGKRRIEEADGKGNQSCGRGTTPFGFDSVKRDRDVADVFVGTDRLLWCCCDAKELHSCTLSITTNYSDQHSN